VPAKSSKPIWRSPGATLEGDIFEPFIKEIEEADQRGYQRGIRDARLAEVLKNEKG
jgi:hypothetical protein